MKRSELIQIIKEEVKSVLQEEKVSLIYYPVIEEVDGKLYAIMIPRSKGILKTDVFYEPSTVKALNKSKITRYGKYAFMINSDTMDYSKEPGYYFLLNKEYQTDLPENIKKEIKKIKVKVIEYW